MQLRLAFELEIGPLRPTGEAVVDFSMRAEQGRIYFDIAKIDFVNNHLYNWADSILNLSGPLATQLNEAVNEAITDLPRRNPQIRKIQILELT